VFHSRRPALDTLLILLLGVAALCASIGCAKRRPPVEAGSAATAGPGVAAPTRPAPEAAGQPPFTEDAVEVAPIEAQDGGVRAVYFDFDSSDLRDDARVILRSNAAWLKSRSTLEVVIEGHCDERGTIEYNLALGQRRANSVRDYLARLGVNGARMSATSYGEERPVDMGHDERAWSKNRRAELVLE
jgi:peptidoglycan-associated lipoprotein